ncbi:isochorismate synthase [Nodosilinea sp. LEGE 06152]|uniref:isochorismate synthase n=1 Tax=Nodosilinea sp. LEGE 06152 TaxID=2777966 RepID=UPI00187E0445|nr:isochorismate synthase [Nodosilinea sp. LEGE 06152]MBE9157150.1 isochorismate synthase [Nodosilinea sp. LEGE 06152]
MPVVSHCSDRGQTLQSVYRFLDRRLSQARQSHQPQLVTLSFDIPPVDPLLVLDRLAPSGDRHLYLENPMAQTSMVGFGTALVYETAGVYRFAQARQFIDQWRGKTHRYSEAGVSASLSGADWARFFCAFTFFADPRGAEATFPAAMVTLPQWQLVRQGHQGVLTLNHLVTSTSDVGAILDGLADQLRAVERLGTSLWRDLRPSARLPVQPTADAGRQFKSAVNRALGYMAQHPVQKIVLAHALDWVSAEPIRPLEALVRLRQRYPDCHIFSVGQGNGQTFMGASPERLLSLTQGQLVTDALAGSAPRGTAPTQDDCLAQGLLHNPKERGEHRLVVEFLARQLQGVGLCPQYQPWPGVRRLSNIQHLHTPMRARVPRHIHPLQIVAALHPTPAVAGVPTREACDQILRFEEFDRSLYAAPLGWVGANGDSEFIVGIRSALVTDTWVRLYAGAGIVAGSDADREWAEIKLKLRALGESLV